MTVKLKSIKSKDKNKDEETKVVESNGKNKDDETAIITPHQRKEIRRDKRFNALRRVLYFTGIYMALYGGFLLWADWQGVSLESQSLAIITTTGGITFGTLIGIIAGSALDN